MTDRKQFEAMLEALINEDQETAKEIFHNIVVGKSREIYEELLKEDFNLAEGEEEEEETSEGAEEEEEGMEEGADEEEEGDDNPFASDEEGEEEGDDEFGGEDDAEGEEDPFGGEEGEGDLEDRVLDLEDALEELKAEFEELMAQEEGEGHDLGGDELGGDMGGEMDAGMGDMGGEEEVDELQQFMEYVDKVALPKHGDNGANAKSVVAGKNDMGGTTANIARGSVAVHGDAGTKNGGGTQGGLLKPSTKPQTGGNVNVPGAKSATKLKGVSKGHGAEKKGAGEQADNKKSIVGSRK